ncbi:MAG: formylglycine-generating enzyme family protein [Planctomycetota bacterium]|jgi:formylglycine-generating enzyme required for sulfatase activity
MKLSLPLKLGIAVVVIFALTITGLLIYRPLKIRYYAGKYENSTDPAERIRIVDILCRSEAGKKALYDAFRRRCISEQVKIPEGSFMMGSEKGNDNEKPVHKVTLSEFWMDKCEVTNEKYYRFVKLTDRKTPQHWRNGKIPTGKEFHPVVWVTWEDAKAFADWLGMRLPIEAEWEYACRAGSTKEFCFGDNENLLNEYGWFGKNYNAWGNSNEEDGTHTAGCKKPNEWGLYDMHGNVWEWCADFYDTNYYSVSPENNPKGPMSGEHHVIRSGGWGHDAIDCRSAYRCGGNPEHGADNGFRVCRSTGR